MSKRKTPFYLKWWFVLLLFVLPIVIWLANWFFLTHVGLDSLAHEGQFGEKFGAAAALFSALAFAGLLLAVLLQKEELKLQRSELKRSIEVWKDQKRTLELQAYETTFFNLLSHHNRLSQDLKIRLYEELDREGLECFEWWCIEFERLYKDECRVHKDKRESEIVLDAVAKTRHREVFGNYVRNVRATFDFVSARCPTEKEFYYDLIRHHLSRHELFFLFYDCVLNLLLRDEVPWVDKFGVLKNLDKNLVKHREHITYFSDGAFAEGEYNSGLEEEHA